MSPESADIWGQFQILANLRKINTRMGHSVQRMLDYRIENGVLPADQLRELAAILEGTAGMLVAFADRVEKETA
jgi:hypothetical protein